MDFNSDGICILESITHPDECDAYVHFLNDERERHRTAALDAWDDVEWTKSEDAGVLYSGRFCDSMAAFYQSAALRHQQDIDGIAKRIKEIEAHKETLK